MGLVGGSVGRPVVSGRGYTVSELFVVKVLHSHLLPVLVCPVCEVMCVCGCCVCWYTHTHACMLDL